MENRYLFKAKRIDNGEWVEGYYVKTKLGNNAVPVDVIFVPWKENRSDEWGWIEIDSSTICQCTGLDDKNGKLIWENDIVKYHFGDVYAPIKYGEYQSCFDSTSTGHIGFYVDWTGTTKENMRKDLGYWINMICAEVVGNIFDNPELLEVGE